MTIARVGSGSRIGTGEFDHHLRVSGLSLGTFLVAAGSQPIIGEPEWGDQSGVSETGSLRERN